MATDLLPMFPLGSALVPGMVLPLHVFEPRYRALARDVTGGDGRFGVVLISHGHEVGGDDRRTTVGTVATVEDSREYDDGRWGVVAVGRSRFRVQSWEPDDPYPRARVEDWPDEVDEGTEAAAEDEVAGCAQRLLTIVDLGTRLGMEGDYPELSDDRATMVWQAAFAAGLGPQDIHDLLCCPGPATRLPMLAEALDRRIDMLRFALASD